MKYKACCDIKCLLAGCEIAENGGCYCACRLNDYISQMQGVIDGHIVEYGCVYFPSKEQREQWYQKLSKEKQELHNIFQKIEAPIILKEAQKQFKEKYENNSN